MKLNLIKASRFFFYAFTFLLPLSLFLILENTARITFLLIFLSLISIFLIVGIIKKGKLEIKSKSISLPVIAFLTFTLFSTFFISQNPVVNSFFNHSSSFILFFLCTAIFFITLNLIKEKTQIAKIGTLLVSSICILNLSFFVVPKIGIGTNTLAILNVIAFILIFFLFKQEKNPTIKALLGTSFFLILSGLILINLNISWFALGIACFLIFWSMLLQNDSKKHSLIMLLISIVSISLFHFNPSFSFEKKEPLTALGFSESLEIAKHSSFLGNGLGTFEQSFLKYNPQMIQDSTHTESFSTILNILNDLGMFGLFLFLLPFSFGIIKGFKRFLKKEQDNLEKMSFISFFILFILSFFYFLDLILMLLLFLFLGLFAGTKGKTILFKNLKPFHIFLIIACLSLTLMSIIVINYFNSLNYFSEAYYNLALEKYQDDEEIAIEYLNKSNAFLKKDKTQIGLSQLYLLKASELYTESRLLETKEEEREEKKQACEDFILLSEKTALSGTEINPFNYSAWVNLGNIYNNRRYLRDEELENETIDAYKKAIELAPYTKEAYIAIIQVFSELGDVEKREEFVEKIRIIDKNYL